MARFLAGLTAILLSVVPFTARAAAADGVDLVTTLADQIDQPVPDSPVPVQVSVSNAGTAAATNVVVRVPVPTGATVVSSSGNCATAAAVITCSFPSVAAGNAGSSAVYLTFAATGAYAIISSASADQPDVDGNSSDQLDVNVVPENADLVGQSASTRIVVGTRSTVRVSHDFTNSGPTAVGNATVSGTVTGPGTIVPGSFNFSREFYPPTGNVADDQCTVTATTFTCTPVFSGGVFYAPQPFVFYDVALPSTPGTVVASATVTGRADPNHTNDTSTFTITVDEPAAEIYTQVTPVSDVVPPQEPTLVEGFVVNAGDIDAQDLVALFEAPADWAIAVPPGPLPPGVACDVIASPHAMRCTRDTLPATEGWSVDALFTPPAGTGSGNVYLVVSTVTPERGFYPNDASTTIQFAPPTVRALDIEPSTALEDGDLVTFSGTGFTPNAPIFYCEAIVTGMTPDSSACGEPIHSTQSDGNGAFSVTVTVERFLVVGNVGVIDCAQPGATCGIGAADFLSTNGSAAIQPMTFTPQPPVDDPLGARISGTVTDATGAPVAGATVAAYRSSDGWVGTFQTTTDASGNYVLEDAEPGIAYRLRFGPPSGSGLVAEWHGGAGSAGSPSRATAVDVRLSAAQPVLDADAALGSGGSLIGSVVGPTGAPVAGVVVWAYRPGDRWVGTYAVRTKADGTYRIDGVEAGTQLRIVFAPSAASGLGAEWFDDSPTRSAATPVVVSPGMTTEVSAQLAASP